MEFYSSDIEMLMSRWNTLYIGCFPICQKGRRITCESCFFNGDGIDPKNFVYTTNSEVMLETAATLTKQLATGLMPFSVFQRLHRNLQQSFGNEDSTSDWINATIQASQSRISSILHDIVHFGALRLVQ
jgi:hypothetical protein